ncbi:MAG TPA: HDOD domain-containing protein [Lautropia sp.]|nr:HDOD domain-containing protein [Lautropia sp.]
MLTKAPASLETWASYFADAPVPVLQETVAALSELLPQQDDVTVSHLAPLVLGDPLMTVKLLAHVAQRRSARSQTGSETVAQAILMMGVQPFFNAFADQPVIEAELAGLPEALKEVQGVLERSRRAALFAVSFAVHRKDPDAEIIHEAALMHDFAEMLLWCHAPALALQVKQVKAENPTLRSAQVQRQVLNIELSDLEHALLQTWRLPDLLVRITNEHLADDPQARTVFLGWRIARHSSAGWDNPSLVHDYRDAADLLGLSVDVVRSKVMKLDEQEPSETDAIAAAPA